MVVISGILDSAESICYAARKQKDMIVPLGAAKIPEIAVSGVFYTVFS